MTTTHTAPTILTSLPADVLLHIMGYLQPSDLAVLGAINRSLHALSCDELLWRKALHRTEWPIVTKGCLPLPNEAERKTYLRGTAHIRALDARRRAQLQPSLFARLLTQFRPAPQLPRVAMFGQGLESSTSSIVNELLWGANTPFSVTQLFPGMEGGVGGGVGLAQGDLAFNLITIYEQTHAVRGQANGRSLLVDESTDLKPLMKQLASTIDSWICVFDASIRPNEDPLLRQHRLESYRHEISQLLDTRWANPNSPLLVLACCGTSDGRSESTIDVAQSLALDTYTRPWQVRKLELDNLTGIVPAIRWVVAK